MYFKSFALNTNEHSYSYEQIMILEWAAWLHKELTDLTTTYTLQMIST